YNILGRCIYDLVIRKDTARRLGITPEMPVQERLKRIKGTIIGAGGIGVIPYQVAYFLAKEAGLEPGKNVTLLGVGDGDSALVALRTGHIDIMSYPPSLSSDRDKEWGCHFPRCQYQGRISEIE